MSKPELKPAKIFHLNTKRVDFDKERFTILIINGNSTGRHCFTIEVGNGSDAQDFDDDNLINVLTSGSGTESNSKNQTPRRKKLLKKPLKVEDKHKRKDLYVWQQFSR